MSDDVHARTEDIFVPLLEEEPRILPEDGDVQHVLHGGPNVAAVVALLARSGLDVNVASSDGWQAVHYASFYSQPRVLEVLCAAGAELECTTFLGETPLHVALRNSSFECARVLLANGVRSTDLPADLVAFVRGVRRCRSAVVAMLCVKRVSGNMAAWDRYVLVSLAIDVWATRYAKEWA